MLLSEFKNKLQAISEIIFLQPDGKIVPKHFHITEVISHFRTTENEQFDPNIL